MRGSDDVMGILKLLSDEEFVSKIISLDSIEEVQKAFKEKGAAITIEQCEELREGIRRILATKDDELDEVVGGECDPLFHVGALDEVIEKRNPFKKPSMNPKTISNLYTSKRAGNWLKNAKAEGEK